MQNLALKGRYPLLYNVSSHKKALVAEMGWFEGNTWRWTLSWGRELTEKEEQQVVQLQGILGRESPSREGKDTILWCLKLEYNIKVISATA